jgi:ABC-type amino acid transport substrate-binding protein
VIKGTTGEFLVQRDFPKSKRKIFRTGEEAARALAKKKIDLFINDSPSIWYLAGIHATEGLTVVPTALSEEQLAWAARKTDDALLIPVNQFLAEARTNGVLLKAFRRWTAIGE